MKKEYNILFVHDGDYNVDFVEFLKSYAIISEQINNKISISLSPAKRHFSYFRLALKALVRRKSFDLIFFWQQYIAIYYSLLSFLFPFNRKPVVASYLIFNKSSNFLMNKLKEKIFLFAFNTNTIRNVVFFDRNDHLFQKINNRFYVPFFQNISPFIEKKILNSVNGDYFFSGGASNRNYLILRDLIELDKKIKVIIACLEKDKVSLASNNRLVCVHDAYNNDFERLILSSKAVIIPLKSFDIISGQIVILKAFQAGKCVFISKNSFISSWLDEAYTKDFLFQFQTVLELYELITQVAKRDLRVQGAKARKYFMEHCNAQILHKSLYEAIRLAL